MPVRTFVSGTPLRNLFTGKERDSETGLDYFGARYYSPALGRWMAVDPLIEKYPSLSSFIYLANNPIINFDPDGRYMIDANSKIARRWTRGEMYLFKGVSISAAIPGISPLAGFADATLSTMRWIEGDPDINGTSVAMSSFGAISGMVVGGMEGAYGIIKNMVTTGKVSYKELIALQFYKVGYLTSTTFTFTNLGKDALTALRDETLFGMAAELGMGYESIFGTGVFTFTGDWSNDMAMTKDEFESLAEFLEALRDPKKRKKFKKNKPQKWDMYLQAYKKYRHRRTRRNRGDWWQDYDPQYQ